MLKKVIWLGILLFVVPLMVILFEYVAVQSSIAFAQSIVDYQPPVVSLVGGIVRIGENIPYDAVPNLVMTLHMLGLFFSVVFFSYFALFYSSSEKDAVVDSPQDN